jgi:NAD(P)-dependent dehydrogenase (short-subunit alcohol dehydrogenase family)
MKQHLTIITGASRGLGLAMAMQRLTPGSTVLCISRRINDELARHAHATGASLEQWAKDLADSALVASTLSAWLQTRSQSPWHSVTLINNAGVISELGPLREGQSADLANALRVGLEAPMLLSAAFLGATRDWKIPRKVLNISSGLGRRPMASSASYCAAKAGMDHFTRSMALEEATAENGARVCSLAPGVIDTSMQVQLRGANASLFPDLATFKGLHAQGQLSSATDTAAKVLAYLERADFGTQPVADIRD